MKALNFFGLLTLLLCVVACSKSNESEEPTPTPTPTPSAPTITIDNSLVTNGLSFTDGASEKSITFTTDADWTLSVAETRAVDWCTPSATSGVKGTATIKFSVKENTGYDNRKAAVTIKAGSASKTFTISQKQKDALLVTTDRYELEQVGGEIEVEVKANINYQIEIDKDAKSWISESTTRALTAHKHSFTIALNDKNDKREGEIRVISGDKQEIIKVYQSGGAILLLSQNEYVVSDAGETIIIEIKSNIEFGIQLPNADWISEVTDTRAVSTHTLKYDIAPNETYDSRSAEIIFYDKNSDLKEIVKIEQAQKDALILSKSKYTIPSEGETIEVVLQSNVKFDISIDADWISQVDAPTTRGLKEHRLYFKVDENTLEEERNASITITDTNKNLSQIIEVTQVKAEERHALMVDGSTFNQALEELSGDLSNIKSIDFIVNNESEPTDYVLLSTSDSDFPIYATYNDGNVRIITIGNCFEFNSDCSGMFAKLEYVTFINFNNYINTSSVTNMSKMFYWCSALTSLDLSSFNTSNVTDMSDMFHYCRFLTSLDLSSFNTSSVTNMSKMFYYCDKLTSLTLNSFNTSNVTDMNYMFFGCNKLTSLDLSSFNTSSVKNMHAMFYICFELTSIDLSGFNTSSVTDMSYMFYNCSALTSLDLNSFNTSSVTNMSGMFFGCNKLTSLDLSSFNTSSVTNMSGMFHYCPSLTLLNVNSFNTEKVEDMYEMFYKCSSLTSLDISSFDFIDRPNIIGMFSDLGSTATNKPIPVYIKDEATKTLLEEKDTDINNDYAQYVVAAPYGLPIGSDFNSIISSVIGSATTIVFEAQSSETGGMQIGESGAYAKVVGTTLKIYTAAPEFVFNEDSKHMFQSLSNITSIDFNNCINTSSVKDMGSMFAYCPALTSLDLSNFNTSSVTDMSYMFSSCKSLTSLDLSNFNTLSVINMLEMFNNCPVLTSLDVSNFNTEKVTDMREMFASCKSLTSLDLSSFNTSSVTNMYKMFNNCPALTSLDVSNFNTSSVKNMSYMFENCSSLTSLDLSSFDFSRVTRLSYIFYDLGKKAANKPIPVYVSQAGYDILSTKDTGINSQYAEIQVK